MRANDKLSGLVVARWADDYNLTGAEAWRMVREGSAEFRSLVIRHYVTSERMAETSRYVDEPDLAEPEIDMYLRSKHMSDDHPSYRPLPEAADHETLYGPDNPCTNPHIRRSKRK